MNSAPVHVVGWGSVTAAGAGVPALRRALEDPSWQPALHLEHPDGPPLPVAVCGDFRPLDHLPPLVARRLDRPSRLLAVAAREALAAAGDPLPWERMTVGVSAGTFNAGTDALLEVLKPVFLGHPGEAPPAQFPSTVANAAASQLGILEKLGGPNVTFAEKQAGGMRALLGAARMLRTARAAAVVAGGVDEAQWLHAECLQRLGVLGSGAGDAPVWGEGAAVLLLTCGHSPSCRAVIRGWGESSCPADPYRYPSDEGPLVRAIADALSRAELAPQDLDLVVSSANGSPELAALEARALCTTFAEDRPAALSITDRLGEGAFSAAVRALVAALAVSGECLPRWPAPPALADSGFSGLSAAPRAALVTAVAGGGSVLAIVVTRP